MCSVLSTGDAHSPIEKRQIQSFDSSSVPQGRSYRGMEKQVDGPARFSSTQDLDGLCSPLSIIYERKELAFGPNRNCCGFAIVEGWGAGCEIGEECILLVGHFARASPFLRLLSHAKNRVRPSCGSFRARAPRLRPAER